MLRFFCSFPFIFFDLPRSFCFFFLTFDFITSFLFFCLGTEPLSLFLCRLDNSLSFCFLLGCFFCLLFIFDSLFFRTLVLFLHFNFLFSPIFSSYFLFESFSLDCSFNQHLNFLLLFSLYFLKICQLLFNQG